ncbi:hypothetical protein RTBOTA2_002076 [Rhodotorula toruloides]|uniref:Uncharacterized protein n=1 Tax=Rhodotorula toruloides TaxID=5286 RepID=A0A2T0A5C6_RHOTO|nr:hypothetical protein RTBOTA2_002076 [Rhodotorula toruloides]PRQ73203.1 hypothetical protein AAT19DRAFT_15956 [Rhodotorula toruloides]
MQDDPPVDSAQRPAVELNAPSPLHRDDPVSPDSSRPAGDQDASLTSENGTDGSDGQADEPRERGVGAEEAKRHTSVKVDDEAGNVAAGSPGETAGALSDSQAGKMLDGTAPAVEEGQVHGPSIESSAGGEEDHKEAVAVDGVSADGTKESGIQEDGARSASSPPAPTLVEPKPSNPLTSTSSLLQAPDARSASPAIPASSVSAAARAIATSVTGASPAPSVSPGPTSTSAASPQPTKKFQSSLAVNKKFLEKAVEKAKPEVKPVTARLATPPVPAPSSTSHPRLFAGKLSSGPITLSTSSSAAAAGWSKKSTAPTPSTAASQPGASASAPGAGSAASALVRGKAGAVWAAPKSTQPTPFGARMVNDFPTAAEAAHAKEARARAIMEQMQARERALQARAAAAAAHNQHLLEELDAFRGVHLDPNASHWDEDDDDFLDTTIEFADGTQYKITEQPDEPEELREPGPSELALREKPLAPGEVVEPPKREERFRDDFDRSWPKKPAAAGDSRALFNDKAGRLEPAASAAAPPARRPAAEPTSIMRPADRRLSDVPPHLATAPHHPEPKPRRPSVTSPRMSHAPLHPAPRRESFNEPKPSPWGRRQSISQGERQVPPHLAAGGPRPPPPHMQPAARSPPTQRQPLPPAQAVLSPPRAPAAALPPAAPAVVSPPVAATAPAAVPEEGNIEEMHAREMHAAAERAKKRREEEEQKRLEQIERAKRKAAELEEKMRAAEEAKKKAKEEQEKKEAETAAKVAKEATPTAPAPTSSAADTAPSWRAAARPPTVRFGATAGPAHPAPATPATAPTKILAREPPAPVQPAKILPRPSVPAAEPPVRQAAWRPAPQQPARPLQPPRPAPTHQLPPHLAAKAAAAQAAQAERLAQASTAPAPATASEAKPPSSPPAEAAAPAAQAQTSPPPRPVTPPPPAVPAIASPPVSPATQERRAAQQAKQAGYKLPAVSQFDDLMSRIKGVMTHPEERAQPADAAAQREVERPVVKLPSSNPAAARRAAAPAESATPAPAPQFVVALPGAGRGRGRGRSEIPSAARQAAPVFENREPVLPIHCSRLSRSASPPPAWRQYTVRINPHPPRRPPPARAVKNFQNPNFPRPLYPFSWSPQLRDVNPRRLSRDDSLLPKRYDKSGTVIYTVSLPKERLRRRSVVEKEDPPAMVVKISSVSLVRQPAPEPLPPSAQPAVVNVIQGEDLSLASPVDAVLGYSPFGVPDRRRAPETGSWRREAVGAPEPGSNQAPAATSRFFPAVVGQAMPPADDLSHGAPGPSDLNGEKVETTPRRETTAPGLGANGGIPSSPPFKQPDMSQSTASPSAAWTNKSLALSVLDPTASSVWSAAPEESSVHARVKSSVQPENSLQGLVDDDLSEALPNSVADLKLDDGHLAEDKDASKTSAAKEEAKLRAVAPSFSSFLHESAGAVDPAAAAAIADHPRAHPPFGPAAWPGIPPQSTPSPISAYSPAQSFSPQLYTSVPPNYGRTLSQQQVFSAYPTQTPSPYAPQHLAQPYSPQHYPSASPASTAVGYSAMPYRDSTSSAAPHGITNPALIANYGYSGQSGMSSARAYGAVGAPGTPAYGRPQQHIGAYGRPPSQHAVAPTAYIASGFGAPFQTPGQSYRVESPYPLGTAYSSSPDAVRPPLPPQHPSSTTMASPVIVPQQPPQVPVFAPTSYPAQALPPHVAQASPFGAGYGDASHAAYGQPGAVYGRPGPAGRGGGALGSVGVARW